MATGVGLRMADDECVVAVVTGDDATLPVHYIVRESVLHMSDDGDAVLGGEQPAGHSHSITGFVSAVGDPAGIAVDDGEAYRAEDLLATAAFCLIDLATDHLNGPAEFYATHPPTWPEANIRALREALDYLGLKSVVLVSERDLPQPDADTGKSFAYNAARAALAAVLSTPAGLTPPDPSEATPNAADVTDVLPALKNATLAQAYSAAVPVTVTPTTAEPAVTGTGTGEQPAVRATPAARPNRGPYFIAAAAAAIGLLLGALGVATVLRPDDSPPSPPSGQIGSEPSGTAGAAPPLLPPASSDAPTPVAPPIAEPVEPAPTTTPPPTTTTAPPTTTEPPRTTPPTTTRSTPTYPYQYPVPSWMMPGQQVPQNPWEFIPQ
ncbi:hypothetical protein LTV02_33005 [Nocardia yamanashiensis]|uniref:hypothetical protein n=1 Tax=Nocardia yamanashiensis TaxID=209247 RepID=UPI001E586E7E|nr:hypothetical protein [Nocardia yamanashiensis]UGT40759.1 hypothetical protein LTV02_33005 [Nocardia yamanashiensis]